jgi:hypothetical protein
MTTLRYTETMNAPADKVYRTMLGLDNPGTYAQWTYEFNPTSQVRGTWEKGAKMHFVGTDENGKEGGMVSVIADHVPGKFVSIQHMGTLDGPNEIMTGPEVEQWRGSMENYSFEEKDGNTVVAVSVDMVDDFIDYFNETWPKALKKLKAMCENN